MGLSGHENFKDENSLNIPDEIWRPIYDKVWPNLSFVDRVWCMSQQLDKEFMEYLILEYTKDPHLDKQLLKKCHKALLVALKTKKQTLDPNVNAAIQKSGTDDDVIQDAVIKNVPVPEHSSVYPSAPEARVETLDTVVIERASALIESCASQPVSERAQSSLDMYPIENLTSPASMTHLFETAVNNADPLAAAAGDVLVNALPEVALKEAYLGTATALDQLSDSKLEPATVEILREIGEFKLGSETIQEDLFSALTRLENTPVTEEVTHAICHVKLAETLPMSLNKLRHLANLDDPRTPKDSFTEIALNLIDVSDGIDTNPHLIATLEQINSPKEDEIAAFSELYEDVYVGSPSPVPIAQAESSETTDINRASKLIEQYAIQPVSEKAQHSLDKYDVKELTSTASMTDLFVTAVNKAVPLASAAGDVLEYALPEVALKKAFSDIAVALNQLNDSDMDSQTIVILREIGKLDLQSKALEQHLLSALARLENTSVPQTLMQALQHVMIALTLPFSLNKLRHLVGLVDPRVPQEMNQSFGEIALALIAESDKIAQNPNALLALSHFTNSEDNDIEALLELYQDAPALVQDKLGDCSKKVLDAVLNSTTQDVPEQPSQSAEHPVSTVAIIEEQGQQPQQPAIGTDSDIEKPPKKEEDIGELLKKADLNSLNAVVTRRFMHILKDIDSQSFENIQRRITKERVAFEKAIEKVREYKISSRNRIAFKGCLALFDS